MPDLGDAARGFFDMLAQVLPHLMQVATDGMAQLLSDRGNAAWSSMVMSVQQSDFNFVTRTPPSMSYNFGGVSDWLHGYDRLYFGVGVFALTVMGIATVGRQVFAWGWEIPETMVRIILAILLGTFCPRIYQATIDFNNRICDAIIGAQLPALNANTGSLDPLTMGVLIVVWLILGIRLMARMGYRIIYFDVVLIMGPFAMAAWAIPGGERYARLWTTTFVGLLLGQDLVSICLRLAGGLGGMLGASFAGLALGIGALLLAYDLATMFAEIRGGGLGSVVREAALTKVLLRR